MIDICEEVKMLDQLKPLLFRSDYAPVYEAVDAFLRHIDSHRLPLFRDHARRNCQSNGEQNNIGYILSPISSHSLAGLSHARSDAIQFHAVACPEIPAGRIRKLKLQGIRNAFCILQVTGQALDKKDKAAELLFVVPDEYSDPRTWYELSDTDKNGPNFCQFVIGRLHDMKREPLYFKPPVRALRKTFRKIRQALPAL